MNDKLPKIIFCSELEEGAHSSGRQCKQYKDTMKDNLKRCNTAPSKLKELARIGPTGDCTMQDLNPAVRSRSCADTGTGNQAGTAKGKDMSDRCQLPLWHLWTSLCAPVTSVDVLVHRGSGYMLIVIHIGQRFPCDICGCPCASRIGLYVDFDTHRPTLPLWHLWTSLCVEDQAICWLWYTSANMSLLWCEIRHVNGWGPSFVLHTADTPAFTLLAKFSHFLGVFLPSCTGFMKSHFLYVTQSSKIAHFFVTKWTLLSSKCVITWSVVAGSDPDHLWCSCRPICRLHTLSSQCLQCLKYVMAQTDSCFSFSKVGMSDTAFHQMSRPTSWQLVTSRSQPRTKFWMSWVSS